MAFHVFFRMKLKVEFYLFRIEQEIEFVFSWKSSKVVQYYIYTELGIKNLLFVETTKNLNQTNKKLGLCRKLKLFNHYIFATGLFKPLIF